jgi:uncharacterized protein YdcH (DUF465 family)
MRLRAWRVSLLIVVFAGTALAQQPAPVTAPAPVTINANVLETNRTRLAATVAPEVRPKVQSAKATLLQRLAAPLPKGKTLPPDLAKQVAIEAGFTRTAGFDVDGATMLVMLEAHRDVSLRASTLQREITAIDAAKACKGSAACIAKIEIPVGKDLTYAEAQAMRDRLVAKKDSLSELSQQDMLFLQQLMERKNQLEQMISNVMKAGYEGGQAAVQSIKAS